MSKVEVENAGERDWAELHPDVLMVIFRKVGMHEVLLRASKVCRSWRKAARDDPLLWRRIDMGMGFESFREICKFGAEIENSIIDATSLLRTIGTEMTKVAVNWGGNGVEQLLIGPVCDANLFDYVAERYLLFLMPNCGHHTTLIN